MGVVVRRANLLDVEQMSEVYVSSWKTTYKGIFPDKFLDSLTPESRYEQWRNNINDSNNIVLVLEKDQKILGLAVGAPVKEGEFPEFDGDVTALYFKKEFQRQGYGKQLINALFKVFKEEMKYKNSIVKVLKDNNSKYFYEKLGASLIDERPYVEGKEIVLSTYAWKQI